MKLCYQVATSDVAVAPSVTAYQGDLDRSFEELGRLGYDGVELMTLDPDRLDREHIKSSAEKNGLDIVLVCTGEIFGQLGLSYTDPDEARREEAIQRTFGIIDLASYFGANINIGRIRGQYCDEVAREQTYAWAVDAFRRICDHAAPRNVQIALESVTIMQTNFINTIEEAAHMADVVDRPNFKLMMDVFHLHIEEKDMYETIRKYAGYNIHVHLADNNRRYPGQCGMDFEKLISTFHETGYDGPFCVECYQLPDQEKTARGAMAHLAPILDRIYGEKRHGA